MTSGLQRLRLSSGTELAYREAGDEGAPALLLLHGMPNSSSGFRDVIGPLARHVRVIAPDLPGSGGSDPLAQPSFEAFTDGIEELLAALRVGRRFIYLHDFGAPVGLSLAMRRPDLVRGLIIQNANAHRAGHGPQWAEVMDFWTSPNPRNEAAATAHLTLEGTRDQYVKGVPEDIAARIDPAHWIEDWRVMSLPGRLESQRALVADYGRYVARFGEIAAYLKRHQPPALLLWGRHDIYFELAEVLAWMEALPRMEAHILDAGHLLLETHSGPAARLMTAFVTGQA
ncbi:alpha/beta hydrolase [Inquilinus sp.]|uniref:alpha/beta fold hydrolase n=1 Tax=Inquilinus sp. TaxID=1932117 RepID=UPI0031D42A03